MRRHTVQGVVFERSLLQDLRCPLMSGSSDAELAADHGVSASYVRHLRDEMDRDALAAEVVSLARAIAAATGETSPISAIVRRAMRLELERVRYAEAAE